MSNHREQIEKTANKKSGATTSPPSEIHSLALEAQATLFLVDEFNKGVDKIVAAIEESSKPAPVKSKKE